MTETLVATGARRRTRPAVIDCDIHNTVPAPAALLPYLPREWHDYEREIGSRIYHGYLYPKLAPNAARRDAWPPTGGPPGSNLPFLREQLLDLYDIELGVLNCLHDGYRQMNGRYSAVLTAAVNDWQVAEWLDPEPRLRASIVIPVQDAEAAAGEIRRCARDPRFVQVLTAIRVHEPLGKPRYWPIYAAAAECGLPFAIHYGVAVANPPTATGWPSYYLEEHTGAALAVQTHVASLIFEGVFQRFPTLNVALVEGGFAWLPSLMWRLDRYWQEYRVELPWVDRPPSEIIRERVKVTTQPIEEPPDPRHFWKVLEQLGSDDMLMFATDYPHWDFDAPGQALPNGLSRELERKILADNARAFYRF
ncbi:MAG: amidohydrolase [Chloroflexi bacterium]|nr:amidohydrolase [Chloroflexota bacterium]